MLLLKSLFSLKKSSREKCQNTEILWYVFEPFLRSNLFVLTPRLQVLQGVIYEMSEKLKKK